jgi:hypothetical protein
MNAIAFPMPEKPKGPVSEPVKGLRMDAEMLARVERAGRVLGIRSFSEQVRFLLNHALNAVLHDRPA